MPEYFIVSHSFAAPFFSDEDTSYISGQSPEKAMVKFVARYKHPAGLYSASLYLNADSYHKGGKELVRWLCNHEIEKQEITKDKGSYSYLGHDAGKFEINGELHVIRNPKGGRIVRATS
jgi:hypothetical protein